MWVFFHSFKNNTYLSVSEILVFGNSELIAAVKQIRLLPKFTLFLSNKVISNVLRNAAHL